MKKVILISVTLVAVFAPVSASAATKKPVAVKHVVVKPYAFPPPDKVLDQSDIEAFINAVKNYRPEDEFAPGFDETPMQGRAFSIDLPVVERFSEIGGAIGGWHYDKDGQVLSVNLPMVRAEGWQLLEAPDAAKKDVKWINGMSFDKTEKVFDPELRSNAFGATVQVTSKSITNYGLAVYGSQRLDKGEDYSAKIPPDQARELTKNIVLHLEGTLSAFGMNEIVGCATADGHEATITEPFDMYMTDCMASSQFSKAELRDKRDGHLLASLDYLVKPRQ